MSFWDNVKKFAQPYSDDDYDDFDENESLFENTARQARRTAATAAPVAEDNGFNGKVLNMNAGKPGMVLFRPVCFADAARAADDLRERKAVIVNLENLDKTVARRVMDFLSGCSYALDGNVKKVAASTYLFCPHNMDVAGDFGTNTETGL